MSRVQLNNDVNTNNNNNKILLTDAEICNFIETGYHIIPIEKDYSQSHHDRIGDSIVNMWNLNGQSQFKSGNNIYPAVPELSTILHSPHFAGAVESILGEEYVLHAHRALHVAKIDQSFHQDTPEGHGPYRLHRPKFIMVMYYPYGSTFEMGPTAILPNGSYLQVNPDERVALGKSQGKLLGLTETKLNTLKTGQAFAVMIHFHIWHRGTKRLIEEFTKEHPARPMVKFQFFTTHIPTKPTWNHNPKFLPFPNATLTNPMLNVWRSIYTWMKGGKIYNNSILNAHDDDKKVISIRAPVKVRTIDQLLYLFNMKETYTEKERIGAAYAIGAALHDDNQDISYSRKAKIFEMLKEIMITDYSKNMMPETRKEWMAVDNGDRQIALHRATIWALAESGDAAIPILLPLLRHKSFPVASRAAIAIGEGIETVNLNIVKEIGTLMERLQIAVEQGGKPINERTGKVVSDEDMKNMWRRSIKLSSKYYKFDFTIRKESLGISLVSQAIWGIAQRIVYNKNEKCAEKLIDICLKYISQDNVYLTTTTRQNMCYALLTFAKANFTMSNEQQNAIYTAMESISKTDDDRYTMATAYYVLHYLNSWKMLEEAEKKGEDLAILQRFQNQHELKMVEMRWCPITHGGAPF